MINGLHEFVSDREARNVVEVEEVKHDNVELNELMNGKNGHLVHNWSERL